MSELEIATIAVVGALALVGAIVLVSARRMRRADERAAAAVHDSEAQLSAIVDSAMDAIITVDSGQKIVLFNRAAEQVFRCRKDEALGASLERFLPVRFRTAHRGHIERFSHTGVTSRRMGDMTALSAIRADGSEEFPIEASISQTEVDGRHYYTVILRDITARKQAEDQLVRQQNELRELSAQVFEAREEEKTLIARELHDELGQLLTAMKMDLSWLRERLPALDPALEAKARQMNEVLDQTVGSVRRIAADLRPLMLDDLGLADAAGWLVEDFARRSGIECRIDLPPAERLETLGRDTAIAVYRVLQEALTNIARHSGAKHAWAVLEAGEDSLMLEVEDDGRGISAEALAKSRSLGVKGMRERMLHLGGALEVSRAPRGGTRV
ncbi:MAG: PAS domain-containing sensor histidine kinase, partial [Burkholderiales bacterium]